jgi:ribosomal 50S subunit-associated protein YjgA (DUF615 family)
MEIRKPTLQGIQLSEIGLANQEKGSEIASRINNENALKQQVRDVVAYARNNDANGINELLENNQTLTNQKTQVHLYQDNFETPKSTDIQDLNSNNEAAPKVDPGVLSLLEKNLLAARFASPMVKKLS